MPLTGTLRTWHDDRGYGFIAPAHGGAELFVHVSDFPADGTRPTVGEKLTYELGRGKDGRPRAVRVVRTAVGAGAGRRDARRQASPKPGSRLVPLLALALLVGGGAYGYREYQANERRAALADAMVDSVHAPPRADAPAGTFRCNGRTMCSQMTSCAEATWVLAHCPDTKMDGDGDGVPCEQQWCRDGAGR